MDNFREWLSDNLRYILLGLAIGLIAIIIVCVVRLAGGSSKKNSQPAAATTAENTTKVTEKTDASASDDDAAVTGNDAAVTATAASGSDSLKKDDPAILALVQKYYTAVASKDTATLATIVDPWNDEIQNSILSNTVIESYDNISTYSKTGPTDGTYVVYAYYDGKIKDIATEAPSLALLYLVTNDSGELVVGDRNSSSEIADFISQATAAADVQALKNDVNQKLLDAEASDADLKAFIEGQSTGVSSEQSTESDSATGSTASGGTATTTAGVNIRATGSPDGAIVGVTYAGAEVTVIEKGAEWTHINFEYDGTVYDGYVATQYLDFGDSSADSTSASSDASQDTGTDASATLEASGSAATA